jgi:hypothetical protein
MAKSTCVECLKTQLVFLLWKMPIWMQHPFGQLIKVATHMSCMRVGILRMNPLVYLPRDCGHIRITHDDLSEIVNAVVFKIGR